MTEYSRISWIPKLLYRKQFALSSCRMGLLIKVMIMMMMMMMMIMMVS